MQDGRIHIEKINAPFLFKLKVSGPEFGAGIKMAVERLARVARERDLCPSLEDGRRLTEAALSKEVKAPK
ncbi:hypothetical protein [Bradyrhizobium sp. CCGUVB23]|uniref:hypothetical protein n=1 Tax=Bradyrhizobium sp. CCGUVB23 TaxID=2949630 RepID=UPI003532265F